MTVSKKNCRFCDKQGVWIYPLRYAVAVATNPANLQPLPGSLPSSLGQNVTDIALSANARYTARVSRGGYIYALIERSGMRYWQAYLVVEDSLLYQFDPESPPSQPIGFSCERTSCGIDASVIAINDVNAVSAVWLLFAPSTLTKAKLDEYKKNADGYTAAGKMQVFDVKAWATEGTFQTHMLTPAHLKTNVPEFVLYAQGKDALTSPLGLVMKEQMFPAINAAYAGTPPKADGAENGYLGVLAQRLTAQKAMVCVLFDHIGIAQELNDFRNAPMEGVEHYLAMVDRYGASNLQRLQVYEAIREIENGMKTGLVTSTQRFQDDHRQWSDGRMNQQLEFAKRLRAEGRTEDATAIEKDVESKRAVRELNYNQHLAAARRDAQENWAKDYGSRLDLEEMSLFDRILRKHTQAASDAAVARAGDHLKWFQADRLVDTFDMFDPQNLPAGYDFAINSALCTMGLSSCKIGEDKIDAWLKAPEVGRKNLYVRGVYYNQDTLIGHVKEANQQIKDAVAQVDQASGVTTALMLRATKGLVDGFKKVDSAFDEWARNQDKEAFAQKWTKSLEVVLYHKAADMVRAVFRAGLGGAFDKGLTASLSGLLYARLRATVGTLAYEELMLSIPKEKLAANARARAQRRAEGRRADKATEKAVKAAGQVDGSLEALVADAQDKARAKVRLSLKEIEGNKSLPTNNYHQARIGVLLGCIEMIALGEKISHFEPNTKGYLEVGGSAMAVGSIVLDTFYSATKSIREIKPYSGITAINKGADIVRGGFKLGAGVLGVGAGICGVWLDSMKVLKEPDPALVVIYSLRAGTGLVSAGLTMLAAFSYAKPFLEHLAKGVARNSIRYGLLVDAAAIAGRLAARVRLLVWVARFNLIGLALTAVEIGYLLLKDDDLQNWCEKCVFRKIKTSTNWLGRQVTAEYFEKGAVEELTELEKAAQAVGAGG